MAGMKRPRFQFGVRLALLLMALLCVLAAYYRARLDLRREGIRAKREGIRAELHVLEEYQQHLEERLAYKRIPATAKDAADLATAKQIIAKHKRNLGEAE